MFTEDAVISYLSHIWWRNTCVGIIWLCYGLGCVIEHVAQQTLSDTLLCDNVTTGLGNSYQPMILWFLVLSVSRQTNPRFSADLIVNWALGNIFSDILVKVNNLFSRKYFPKCRPWNIGHFVQALMSWEWARDITVKVLWGRGMLRGRKTTKHGLQNWPERNVLSCNGHCHH